MRRRMSAAKKAWLNAYGMSMRLKGEIIGKLGGRYLGIVFSELQADIESEGLTGERQGSCLGRVYASPDSVPVASSAALGTPKLIMASHKRSRLMDLAPSILANSKRWPI